jgi:flagellum-specific peptidoglycan hydrolase FlgJ
MKWKTVCLLILTSFGVCRGQDSLMHQAIYPKVAIAIYKHESAHGKSKLATQHNNLYGFKYGKRAIGKTRGKYSIYKSKSDSILDYLDFERKIVDKYKLTTREKYLRFLSRRYASDGSWLRKIRKFI